MEIRSMQVSRMRVVLPILLIPAAVIAQAIEPGLYDVSVSVQIPNVRVTNADFTTRLCWRGTEDSAMPLGPLGPGPLRSCPAEARHKNGRLIVDNRCDGPNAGWAVSNYRPTAAGFFGTVDINMGGKNMTVREVQRGVRIGDCTDP